MDIDLDAIRDEIEWSVTREPNEGVPDLYDKYTVRFESLGERGSVSFVLKRVAEGEVPYDMSVVENLLLVMQKIFVAAAAIALQKKARD